MHPSRHSYFLLVRCPEFCVARIDLQRGMKRSERPRRVLSLLPKFGCLADGIASIQRTPHVSQRLLISCAHVRDNACNTLATAARRHVCLADRGHDRPRSQVAVECKKALEVHVQVLANGLGIAIPTTDSVHQLKGKRVNRGRWRDRRSLVQTRHSCRRPQNIGDTNNCGHTVSIPVKDDRCRVESRVRGFRMGYVHSGEKPKVIGGKVAVGCMATLFVSESRLA